MGESTGSWLRGQRQPHAASTGGLEATGLRGVAQMAVGTPSRDVASESGMDPVTLPSNSGLSDPQLQDGSASLLGEGPLFPGLLFFVAK